MASRPGTYERDVDIMSKIIGNCGGVWGVQYDGECTPTTLKLAAKENYWDTLLVVSDAEAIKAEGKPVADVFENGECVLEAYKPRNAQKV